MAKLMRLTIVGALALRSMSISDLARLTGLSGVALNRELDRLRRLGRVRVAMIVGRGFVVSLIKDSRQNVA